MNRPAFGRIGAIIVSVVGLAGCAGLFVTFWLSPEETRLLQLRALVDIASLFLVLAIALIIAWRGGAHGPNVAMALALAFVFGTGIWELWRFNVWPQTRIFSVGDVVLFYLGASFFIRAAQSFPRALGPADVAQSATIWGRVRALRAAATMLLRPWAVWAVSACLTAVYFVFSNVYAMELARMAIVLLGIVYFYISFRSGDATARAKVLWFLEAAVASLVIGLIVLAVRTVLGDTPAPTLRAFLSLVLTALNSLALTTCFAAAVFYAGAIDPALVMRKTLVAGATVSMLLFLFAAIEHYVIHLLVHGIGVTNSLATAVLGALLGYAFHPLKHRIEHFLKRFVAAKSQ